MSQGLWEIVPQESANEIHVASSTELAEALEQAVPGITILIADGSYDYPDAFTIQVQATVEMPVTIRAVNQGKAIIMGNARFQINESAYIIIKGLRFTNTGNTAVLLNQCNHIRLTRNTFALKEDGTELRWLNIKGEQSHHNWIDHNEFGPRRDKGMYVSADGANGQMSQYDVYEYNYFHGLGPSFPRSEGEIKALRIGLSGVSMSDGFNLIQYNLFEHCDANPEIISVKSCGNEVRNNTFRNCEGHLTSRHGHNNRFYGNLFLGDGKRVKMGGFRIYGNDHHIYDNYLENLTDWAVNVDGGRFDGGTEGNVYTKEVLTAHWRNYRPSVYRNVIVNGPGINIGDANKPFDPVNANIYDNRYIGQADSFIHEVRGENTRLEGNQIDRLRDKDGGPDGECPAGPWGKPLTPADVGPDAP